jgi:hypothetical protein
MLAAIPATAIAAYQTSGGILKEDRTAIYYSTNPTGDFNASGTLASLINGNDSGQKRIIAGVWNLIAEGGNVSSFKAQFTTISSDGTERHEYTLENFTPNVVIPLILDEHGASFTGMVDIRTDGKIAWQGVQVTVTIAKHDAIKIMTSQEDVNSQFNGQPIYGIVYSIRDVS